ncbi:MAG: T9SS type A sorting domain-containing protein, partial [Candidatus Kapaibacterium sp.]
IQGTRGADTVGTLFALNYTAVLGSTDRTALTLTDFQWIGVTGATIDKKDGQVLITDICRESGDRYLVGKSNGYGVRVYPTPATSEVTIDVKGLGTDQLRWTLCNMLGEVVADGTSRADASGALQMSIDVSAFGAGTYAITAAARGDVQYLPFVIQR